MPKQHLFNVFKQKDYFLEKFVKIITKSNTSYQGVVRDFNTYTWELETDEYIWIIKSSEVEGILIGKKENGLIENPVPELAKEDLTVS